MTLIGPFKFSSRFRSMRQQTANCIINWQCFAFRIGIADPSADAGRELSSDLQDFSLSHLVAGHVER
jgi:hypothetical protein